MSGPIHPGLKIYREARARGRAAAIKRKQEEEKRQVIRDEVVKGSPDLATDPKKLEAVVDGVIKSRQVKKTKIGKNKRATKVQHVPTFVKHK